MDACCAPSPGGWASGLPSALSCPSPAPGTWSEPPPPHKGGPLMGSKWASDPLGQGGPPPEAELRTPLLDAHSCWWWRPPPASGAARDGQSAEGRVAGGFPSPPHPLSPGPSPISLPTSLHKTPFAGATSLAPGSSGGLLSPASWQLLRAQLEETEGGQMPRRERGAGRGIKSRPRTGRLPAAGREAEADGPAKPICGCLNLVSQHPN